MPFFPLASRFATFFLGHTQKSKFWKWPTPLGFWGFLFSIFLAFTFLLLFFFAAVIDLLLGLVPLVEFLSSLIETGNSYHGVRRFFLSVFHRHFWAFWCIFQAQLTQLLWSGYHWKDIFLQQNLWWRQSWSNMTSEEQWPVIASYSQHRRQWVKQRKIYWWWCFLS